ncbi:MAG: universal stress protein [Desulfobacterales bacterium]|nr:universal stress protein [Desulfobacterales bacterium]
METFAKILVPVDLSDASPLMVPYVKTMSTRFSSAVHLLFVARILDYFSAVYVPSESIDHFEKAIMEGAWRRLEEFRDQYFGDIADVRYEVVAGDAAEQIIAHARNRAMDLIIIGTHGRKGLDRIVFGSVAQRVCRRAGIPVLLINPYRAAGSHPD